MKNYQSIITLIENLINEHDCIIIPNFGGFVVNIEDFKLNQNDWVISPRKRWIAFNKQLKSDDGLLATQWANMNQISHKEGFQEINQFSKFITAELIKNEQLAFGNIGEFQLSTESKITFIPNSEKNYDLSMFGLTSVNIVPITSTKNKPELIEPKIDTTYHEEISQVELESEISHSKSILPKHIIYTILAFIFAGFSAYFLTEPNSRYVNSSFSPFTIKIAKKNIETPIKKKVANQTINSGLEENEIRPAIDSNKITQVPANNISLDKIELIAASFLTMEKAETALAEFQSKGFSDAKILAKGENEKFYRVSVGIESTFESGYKTAARLKKENKLDIWVYKPTAL